MKLTLLVFYYTTISMAGNFKNIKVKLHLLTYIDMLLMIERGIRGKTCQAIYRYGKAEYGEVLSSSFNCSDKTYERCKSLLINSHYSTKNVQITFKLKICFTCNSFNLIYVFICDTCKKKYIEVTGEGKIKLRDRVRVYRQHIRQPPITKDTLSGLRQFLATESSFKMKKNAFYFASKAPFVLKIFKFLS